MASWNGTEVIHYPDEAIDRYPGWVWRDCGCCNGIEWSAGYEPIECSYCWGAGRYAVHLTTGTRADYPGGSLMGWHEKKVTNGN